MMNTKLIILRSNKNQVSEIIDRPRTVQEDDAITNQFYQERKQDSGITADDWKIFMPIMNPFE